MARQDEMKVPAPSEKPLCHLREHATGCIVAAQLVHQQL